MAGVRVRYMADHGLMDKSEEELGVEMRERDEKERSGSTRPSRYTPSCSGLY